MVAPTPVPSDVRNFEALTVLIADEASYAAGGAAGAPALVPLDAHVFGDVQIRREGQEYVPPRLYPWLGNRPSHTVARRMTLSGHVPLCLPATPGGIPPADKLLRGCGLTRTAVANTPAATISTAVTLGATTQGRITITPTAAYGGRKARTVRLTCTTAGGAGTAVVRVTSPAAWPDPAVDTAGVTLTAAPITLAGGATVTVAVTTPLALGDTFDLALQPAGNVYRRSSAKAQHLSLTGLVDIDGETHRFFGARGTAALRMRVNEEPSLQVTLTGLILPVTETADIAANYTAWPDPPLVLADTTALAIQGVYLASDAVELDLGNEVALREKIGRKAVRIGDWAPRVTATVEAPSLADLDLWALAGTSPPTRTRWDLAWVPSAGRGIDLLLRSVQLADPSPANDDGDYTLQLTARPLPVAGDDELELRIW